MADVRASDWLDFFRFPSTFIRSDTLFEPAFQHGRLSGDIGYLADIPTLASSSDNVFPIVAITGEPLVLDPDTGLITGTGNSIRFSSSNRGEVGRIDNISFEAEALYGLIIDELNGDPTAPERFERFIASQIGVLTLSDRDDTLHTGGFFRFLDEIDLGAGDDDIRIEQALDADFVLDGGSGNDTLRLSFRETESMVVDLRDGTWSIGDGITRSFKNFEEVNARAETLTFFGSAGDDEIWTWDDDTIYAGAGNDTIQSRSGLDRIFAGPGDDLIYSDSFAELVIGGPGEDTLDVGSSKTNYQFTKNGEHIFFNRPGGPSAELIDLEWLQDGGGIIPLRHAPGLRPEIEGTRGADLLRAEPVASVLRGDNGNDTLIGGVSEDDLTGGNGNDRLAGAQGDDTLDGGFGSDHLHGGLGMNTLIGGPDVDTLVSTSGRDVIDAGRGDGDVIYLDSPLNHGPGSWAVNLTTGAQVSVENLTMFASVASGNLGDGDQLNLTDRDDALFLQDTLSDQPADYEWATGHGYFAVKERLFGVEIIDAGAGDDVIDLSAIGWYSLRTPHPVTVLGGAGNDVIWATPGVDTIDGGTGDDTIFAFKDTVIHGGAGADTFEFISTMVDGGRRNAGSVEITDYNPLEGDRLVLHSTEGVVFDPASLVITANTIEISANAAFGIRHFLTIEHDTLSSEALAAHDIIFV
ncbi:calcium-binding protein [Pseudaestuariivita sp.]|uniref:calcium-binding protein n=1 Tax=Pseudaestuariivita sp. TaxID=2211669 RepID=UPI004058180F